MVKIVCPDTDQFSSCTVYVMHWDEVFATVDLSNSEEQASTTVSPGNNTLTATEQTGSDTPASALPLTIGTGAENVAVATGENNTLQFLIGATAGTVVANTLTLKNQCPFPVQFMVTPNNGVTPRVYVVPANEDMPVSLAGQFQARAHLKGFAIWPDKAPETDTPTVAFSSDSDTLTIQDTGDFTYSMTVSD